MKPSLQACFVLLMLFLAGCRSRARLAPVEGRATLGQKPLARVTIQLVPDAAKGTHAPAGAGQTDENGAFRITTPPHGAGAVPGFYKVTVTAYHGHEVPPSYASPTTTPLRIEVPRGGLKNWELNLSEDGPS
jgi:hypothetical protein